MQTFLFYDIETTGLSKPFDQVLQFAGIRTDAQLNEIERYVLNIKLNKDVIPSPYALITHYIGINNPHADKSEYDAIKQIHQWINQPQTISLGYNTLGFDDEFLRFSFFRNLLPPYTHQYANQCGRMDIYPMTVMYYLFKPLSLNWPSINGKISLKLENLNIHNNLAKGRAHDAMVDVEATLQLAKILYQEREMWDYIASYFVKTMDAERTQPLKNSMALIFDGVFGFENAYQCPVLYIGDHHHYKNQSLWLRLDNELITQTTPATFATDLRVINKKMGEPGFVLPLKDRFLSHLKSERLALAENNLAWLNNNPDTLRDISEYFSNYKHPVHAKTDIDASLYIKPFKSFPEERFCEQFHRAKPHEKAILLEKQTNADLRNQALRLLGRNFPEALTPAQQDEFNQYLASINPENEEDAMIDFQNKKRLTPHAALLQINEIRHSTNLNDDQLSTLKELEIHLTY